MIVMKRVLTSVIATFCLMALYGQSNIVFEKVDHDFGDIEELGGPVSFTFKFTNTGDVPIRITNVKASCGCTTPGWSKDEVLPGETGYVKAQYNPRNRPGRFRKSLRITASDPSSSQTLYIMGFVKPKPKTPEEEYPVIAGDVRLKYRGLNIGKITNEKSVTKTFDIYNGSDTITSLKEMTVVIPDHINLELNPAVLNPKETGQLLVTYDPIKKNDFGFVSDNIKLSIEDEEGLSVMAIIEEHFPEMTAEELDKAPKLQISQRVFDFGKVAAGTILETAFELTNEGSDKLIFRSVKSNCGCITYELNSKTLKRGKSQTLKVFFDTSEMNGNQYKSITIYANDPVNPTQLITIKGNVERGEG